MTQSLLAETLDSDPDAVKVHPKHTEGNVETSNNVFMCTPKSDNVHK